MQACELCARFALAPNSKSYCGKGGFSRVFSNYLKNKTPASTRALEKALSSFRAHYSYLRLIAKANKRKPFDAKVAEALWIGNSLLGNVKQKDLAHLIKTGFAGKGMLSRKRAGFLARNIPKGFLAHHTFHVLYLHTITGVIAPSLKNADLCRPSWGRAIRIEKNHLLVQSQRLAKRNGKLVLVPCKKRLARTCAGILLAPRIKFGDFVASHWGFAVMPLSSSQAKSLEKYTRMNIEAAKKRGFPRKQPCFSALGRLTSCTPHQPRWQGRLP